MKTALLCAAACLTFSWTLPTYAGTPLYTYVNPMVGVGNDNEGDTVPGPALPSGSIHPSPETLTGSNAGYDPATQISGFGQLHTQGSGGVTTYGTFLVSPQVGAPVFDEAAHLSDKSGEQAAADLYAVTLDRYQTRVEVTPSHYAAIYRVSFPQTDQAQLVFDITRKIKGLVASDQADVTLYPEAGKIIGHVKAKGYWNPALVDIWFCAEVDQKPTAWGVFKNGETLTGATSGATPADQRLGAWWSFDTQGKKPVLMKIAVSFISAEKAEALLDHDIPAWDFDGVRQAAQSAWDASLSKIEISDVPEADLKRFYTALYHTAIQPRDRSLDQADGDLGTPHWDDYYTLWDTYRTEFPLMSLIRPRDYAGNIASIVHAFDRFGAFDTAFIAGQNYHVGQGGDEVDNVIGEGLIRGVPGVNWQDAYRVTHFNAFQRRSPRYLSHLYFAVGDKSPEPDNQRARSGSSTIGFALNDFYAGKLAEVAGHTNEAAVLASRAKMWRNVWNAKAESDGYTGFILPKQVDGAFQDIDPKLGWDGKTYNNVGFYEGTAWIYSYDMLHDIPGMVTAMGGREMFIKRLQHALSSGLIDITNEPSFSTSWLFSNVGRPDLSAYWANEIFKKFPANAYPGDEDNGAMSSHYVFNRIGLFPKLGTDLFYLHGPHQPKTDIHLENGKTFTIIAHNAGPDQIYIQTATLNGRPLNTPWISQADIMKGGQLELRLGSQPSHWGQ
ncbi:MAG: GH92 family glycosyl hydrolase [Asticcacaulis sp.]|uniref:GH92 family glycosyl hydrolase n=1 Tax=Asticcacaulis sp. TaxID=1872648 RepID=UPI0039E72A0C